MIRLDEDQWVVLDRRALTCPKFFILRGADQASAADRSADTRGRVPKHDEGVKHSDLITSESSTVRPHHGPSVATIVAVVYGLLVMATFALTVMTEDDGSGQRFVALGAWGAPWSFVLPALIRGSGGELSFAVTLCLGGLVNAVLLRVILARRAEALRIRQDRADR
jgi:hypothetical protein